ncbi:MAG: tRNA 2-selenouridine(34) synthase MnmH [Gammaproteobacteria bacterium]|nr:tRNA 2-selenouridine(34) synthase MnmH [Gammaproteobacteria bacterium]
MDSEIFSIPTLSPVELHQRISSKSATSLELNLIDVRSPAEFALDNLPYSVNWPVLSNLEREQVGTLYKQNRFNARKLGARLIIQNIAEIIQNHLLDTPQNGQTVIYCWRGGKRSLSLATILKHIGFRVHLLDGGYKAWRKMVVTALNNLIPQFQFVVIAGLTGCGKTKILTQLKQLGEQVLDLESLAVHRSSVLGQYSHQRQPSQKKFENDLFMTLSQCNPQRLVFVESESHKVGALTVPHLLIKSMRLSPCLEIQVPFPVRVEHILLDYPYWQENPTELSHQIQKLVSICGMNRCQQWLQHIKDGEFDLLVQSLLKNHYDPRYHQSMGHNFAQYPHCERIPLPALDTENIQRVGNYLREKYQPSVRRQNDSTPMVVPGVVP